MPLLHEGYLKVFQLSWTCQHCETINIGPIDQCHYCRLAPKVGVWPTHIGWMCNKCCQLNPPFKPLPDHPLHQPLCSRLTCRLPRAAVCTFIRRV
jgi:hypothetical protein